MATMHNPTDEDAEDVAVARERLADQMDVWVSLDELLRDCNDDRRSPPA